MGLEECGDGQWSNFVQFERFQELFEALNAKNLSGQVFNFSNFLKTKLKSS